MELVDLENSPYLEVDSSVVLVREMVVDNLVVVVFLLVLEAESELEVSLMMMKVLRQFLLSLSSSLLVSLASEELASLVAEVDLQADLGSGFTVVSVVCCSVLNCGGGNLVVAHSGGGFVFFWPSSATVGRSGGSFFGFGLSLG